MSQIRSLDGEQDKSNLALDVSVSVALKKESRLAKNKSDDNCFVINIANSDDFFKKLKQNLSEFPNETRFQVAIECPGPHWFIMDCYIKDNHLHTFTLDAISHPMTLSKIQAVLTKHFPRGKHYFFDADIVDHRFRNIQYSVVDCMNYVREFYARLADINGKDLFEMLEKHTKKSLTYKKVKTFSIGSLNDEMVILAPIFRCMQSFTNIDSLPESFKNSKVSSKKGGRSLDDFAKDNTEEKQNCAISTKGKKYRNECHKFINDPKNLQALIIIYQSCSGMGFLVLPVLARILPKLEKKSIDEVNKIIKDLITHLNKTAPLKRDNWFFQKLPAKHVQTTKFTIELLENLTRAKVKDNRLLVNKFWQIVTGYAAILDEGSSIRTLATLKKFLTDLEMDLSPGFEMKNR